MDVTDNEHRRRRFARSAWERPAVDQRVDQHRSDTEIPPTELAHPALRELDGVWRRAALAEGQAPPSRAAFRPTDAVEAVGRMTVLDRVPNPAADGHTWRYRLVGTEIVLILQADVTGETIERYHPALAAMLRRQLDRAVAAGEPVAFTIHAVVDHRPYAYEQILLPTRRVTGGPVDQAVIASHPLEAPGGK